MWKKSTRQRKILFRTLHLAALTSVVLFGVNPALATTTLEISDNHDTIPQPMTIISSTESATDTTVITGAAGAHTDLYTETNTNFLDTDADSDEPPSANSSTSTVTDETTNIAATSTDQLSPDGLETIASNSSGLMVSVDTAATSSTIGTTTANSGDNMHAAAISQISTGSSTAVANIVNTTNTNIINSRGLFAFLHQIFGTSALDVRSFFDIFSQDSWSASDTCSTDRCLAPSLSYHSSNTAVVVNNISVTSNTGNNNTRGTSTTISTGNAYAFANVTNIINSNFMDSQYLVLTFSNFGDLLGDIIFPARDLLRQLFDGKSHAQEDTSIQFNNTANVTNELVVDANTGNNTATASASTVTTGTATSYSNVFTQNNLNVINHDSLTLLFRVHGDWDGDVFGLPEGLTWHRTDDGIIINNLSDSDPLLPSGRITASLTNNANIENRIKVQANTGNNIATGDEVAAITTGNAFAAANVTNIANTNVLGRNWSLLIFDIFGDWHGDVTFGQSDLWLGGSAQAARDIVRAGDTVKYTFTISNQGDMPATNVVLNGTFDTDLISFENPIEMINLGGIGPGDTITYEADATVTSTIPRGIHAINLTAVVTSHEPDIDTRNNEEVVTIVAERANSGGGRALRPSNRETPAADLHIAKTADTSILDITATTTYTITLTNSGGPLFEAILTDTLYDPNDEIIAVKRWPLDTIHPDETITITYETGFTSAAPPGIYINRAQVAGYHEHTNPNRMQMYQSAIATVPLTYGMPSPNVLGIATSTNIPCKAYLNEHLRYGDVNDGDEVRKLQVFLQQYDLNEKPAITGFFDRRTERSVKEFQIMYDADILKPWGINEPTGYVYLTTKKKINELHCNNIVTFPLSDMELAEITTSRLSSSAVGLEAPVANTTRGTLPSATSTTDQRPTPLAGSYRYNLVSHPFIAAVSRTTDVRTTTSSSVPSVFRQTYDWFSTHVRRVVYAW